MADDHDVVREGLRTLLETQTGWTVCAEAATGREAVELSIKQRPDVVVLDFSMPELNGLDATLQIRNAVPDAEVLIITMHDSERLGQEAYRVGAHGFLLKTDARRQLVPAVQALSERRTFFAVTDNTVLTPSHDLARDAEGSTGAHARLTPREREILQIVAMGKTSKEVAKMLDIKTRTVEAHRANIMNKLDLHSVGGLVRYAIRNNIMEP